MRFVRRRAVLLRHVLSQATGLPLQAIAYETNRHGKPRIAGDNTPIHFNTSHSGSAYMVALSQHMPVGVDIEPTDRPINVRHVPAGAAPDHERRLITAHPQPKLIKYTMRLWVAKEALLKAIGTGLQINPRSITLPDEVFY